ncbi:MAG: polysaccharide pyruvyl transferase family protein [Piscinibacter sp.]|nr:polysaccharide pyruvyl transferase family protein [Piscinibacter sp.]
MTNPIPDLRMLPRRLAQWLHQGLLLAQWRLARLGPHRTAPDPQVVLVIPADAAELTGSRGDEAMLLAARAMAVAAQGEQVRLVVACSHPAADARARAAGFEVLRVWGGLAMPFVLRRRLAALRPGHGWVMGADMLDGHYSPVTALRMVIAADLMARAGARSLFLGFSLNDRPARGVCLAFRGLDPRVAINLRDPCSWQRFDRATGRRARLVADTAFLLPPAAPQEAAAAAERWARAERQAGRTVLAINAHPMLFGGPDAAVRAAALCEALQTALQAVAALRPVSWLLLPHDERAAAGDLTLLAQLQARLASAGQAHVHHLAHPPSAAAIKGLLGSVDGAVTGRMHLAIAALGQGRPVLAFAYQGKFTGLLQHFELPAWLLLEPAQALDAGTLATRLDRFVAELPGLTDQVGRRLPCVLAQARATYAEALA